MTPERINEYLTALLPVWHELLAVIAAAAVVFILFRFPWGRAWQWLSAPTMSSLVFLAAFCIAAQSFLSSDEMFKYVNPYVLVGARFIFGTFGAGFIALKAYRIPPADPNNNKPTDV